MRLINCFSVFGEPRSAPAGRFRFRPGAYALVRHDRRLLLIRSRETGKWWFPGGGVEPGELTAATAVREVAEETGVVVEVERLFHIQEVLVYVDPADEYWHCFQYFYLYAPLSTALHTTVDLACEEHEESAWVDLAKLTPEQFQHPAEQIFELFRRSLDA